MLAKLAFSIPIVISLFSACAVAQPVGQSNDSAATGTNAAENPTEQPEFELLNAELVAVLPSTVDSFEMESAKPFDAAGQGVNVTYKNDRKRRRANVFIYPVAEKNQDLKHRDLVMGSTQATMQAIAEAVQQGVYQNLEVVDAATRAMGIRTVARVQATYLRKNLASYTLVYQTEHNGTMIKIRMTMPDNETNRKSREWDSFADHMLKTVTAHVDLQNAAEPVLNAAEPELNEVESTLKPASNAPASYENLGTQSAPTPTLY